MYRCFFFSSRRRHTRFDCDWSSDVCSSDLVSSLVMETSAAAMSAPLGSLIEPVMVADLICAVNAVAQRRYIAKETSETDDFVVDIATLRIFFMNVRTCDRGIWHFRLSWRVPLV